MAKKILIMTIFIIAILLSVTSSVKINAEDELIKSIDATSNFFTQKTNQSTIEIIDQRDYLISKNYQKVSENNYLILYLLKKNMAIAIYDKTSGYTWFSNYDKADTITPKLTSSVISKIESGVTIEYYDTNSSTITSAEYSYTSTKALLKSTYTNVIGGFKVDLNFSSIGIKFTVEVKIDDKNLVVNVPYESIEETPLITTIGKKTIIKNYYLKTITLFPYFGSENYNINGYSFVPDGSGALIRYTNVESSTALIKRIYGPDYGLQSISTLNQHLKPVNHLSLPIYGINHGYQQAAFLTEIISGYGACELHSYPYKYNNLPINTTFFRFYTRDNFIVTLSNGTALNLINDKVYPSNYSLKYTFLSNENASYIGMANTYRESLNLQELNDESSDIKLHLEVIGLDYKPGLFGKKYIKMTDYVDLLNIIQTLEEEKVNDFQISYIGWNKGGYFNDGAINGKLASKLGTKKDFYALNEYIDENNYDIDFKINPLISDSYGFWKKTIKRPNLATFDTQIKSSINTKAYYNLPVGFLDSVKNNQSMEKLGIDSFYIDRLSDAFSYRYKNITKSREEMIEEIQLELEEFNQYQVSASNPNNYLLSYIKNFYDMNYESSKYIYATDSIPFMSILLSGYVNLYMSNINYISDYDLLNLRMVEYNLYPSFIITDKETYKLRFTNFEYVNSTEFALWKDLISSTYSKVNDALKNVVGAKIINHQYIEKGICEVEYDNGFNILVNYTNSEFLSSYGLIKANDYLVVRR